MHFKFNLKSYVSVTSKMFAIITIFDNFVTGCHKNNVQITRGKLQEH